MTQIIDLTTGLDLDQKRAIEEIQEQEDFSTRIINASIDGILAFDRNYRYTIFNPALERMSGMKKEDVLGWNVFERFPFIKDFGIDEIYRAALNEGKTGHIEARRYRIPSTGKDGWSERYISPARDETNEIVGVLVIVHDVTDKKVYLDQVEQLNNQLERRILERTSALEAAVQGLSIEAEERRRAEESLKFLIEAGIELASSLGYASTLQSVQRLTSRQFDGWCILRLLPNGTEAGRTMIWHNEAAPRAQLEELERLFPAGFESKASPAQILKDTGEPLWIPCLSEDMLRKLAQSEEHFKLLRDLKMLSFMAVPLNARGRLVGSLGIASPERYFTSNDLQVAKALAQRCALAIDNTRLFSSLKSPAERSEAD